MNPASPHSKRCLIGTLLAALFFASSSMMADIRPLIDAVPELTSKSVSTLNPSPTTEDDPKSKKPQARLFLTNGDTLSGLPKSINEDQNLLFQSDSLHQTADFPMANVLSMNFNSWKPTPANATIARVQLHPRFRENTGDTILGTLKELTPESIKLDTWYGGIITLKRSMVLSLNIISNTSGNYYGPNNINEWNLSDGLDSWLFNNGSLVSQSKGSIGRDMGLRKSAHVSFDASWKSTMRFKVQLYSSDTKSKTPSAYYEVNINRSYAYLRTRGKTKGRGVMGGGGRWKQINVRPKEHAHFDLFINRKIGSITLYINGVQACVLQSQSPDPENLGQGIAFIAEERYPLKIKNITVSPWNGTSLPQPKTTINQDAQPDNTQPLPPHKIILNNGDEVPGTVGKVLDDRMIIETQFTPIHIPINRIKSLSLGNKGEQPIKKGGDIRAWFHGGGHITLKLASFKNNQISGYGQAFGDVTLDLAAFSRIDFHIYDNKANELRNKLR